MSYDKVFTRHDFGIEKEYTMENDGITRLFIDTKKARYQGDRYCDLGTRRKRKFENLLYLSRPHKRLKVIYS